MGEKAGEPGLVGGVEAAGRQQVLAGGQLVAAALLGTLPGHIERLEEALEELQPGVVDVRIGDRGVEPVDANHQHMGIGGADVVLDEQAAVMLGRRRPQSGVVELQGRRAIEACHEGFDTPPALLRKAMGPGACNRLHRSRGLKLVDGAVGIHHDEVQTVSRLAVAGGDRRDQVAGNGSIVERRHSSLASRAWNGARSASGRHSSIVSMPDLIRRSRSGPCGTR